MVMQPSAYFKIICLRLSRIKLRGFSAQFKLTAGFEGAARAPLSNIDALIWLPALLPGFNTKLSAHLKETYRLALRVFEKKEIRAHSMSRTSRPSRPAS